MIKSYEILIFKFVGVLFIFGGLIHFAILAGFLVERAPSFISWYFHSLSILDIVTGIGLYKQKTWAVKLGLFIMYTQIPTHSYMLYLDMFQDYRSGVPEWQRFIELGLAIFYISLFSFIGKAKTFTEAPIKPSKD